MVEKKSAVKTATKTANKKVTTKNVGGMDLYLKRVFSLMFGAVGITALSTFFMLQFGGLSLLISSTGGFTGLYYIILFGGLGLSIWAQTRAFSMEPKKAAFLLALYSFLIGWGMTPLIAGALYINPAAILQSFVIASLMFACMATFGYKTAKDLSFMGIFLFLGMIGLLLVGIFSIFWPLGSTFATIVCLVGVLIFALFTAYDMQNLKRAYSVVASDKQRNQLAVLGALHLYISFIAMFQYLLSFLLSRD